MPNWKKVVTSGSNAVLNHITASGNISASGNIDSNKFQAYNAGFSGSYLTSNKIVVHETDSDIEAFSVVASAAKASLVMKYAGNPRVYIDPVNNSYIWTNGNFGIGDTTPSYKLDVAGTGRFASTLLVNSNVTGLANSSFGTPSGGGNLHQHLFTGNITASDNISASAAGIISSGTGSFHYLKGNTANATGLEVSGYILSTNITASGNISSSGTITTPIIQVGDIKLGGTVSTNFQFNGTTINSEVLGHNYSVSIDEGDLICLKGTNSWEPTDANVGSVAKSMLAIATDDPDTLLTTGIFNLSYHPGGSPGDPLYMSETSALITSTAPTTDGAIVRVVGYNLHDSNGMMYFNPDNTWVELTA